MITMFSISTRRRKKHSVLIILSFLLAFELLSPFDNLKAGIISNRYYSLTKNGILVRHHCAIQETDVCNNSRSERFPSVSQRVKIYMSDWYLPPCPSKEKTMSFEFIKDTFEEQNKQNCLAKFATINVHSGFNTTSAKMNISNKVVNDRLFFLDPDVIEQCSKHQLKSYLPHLKTKYKGLIGIPSMKWYCRDVVNLGLTRFSRKTAKNLPILFSFGDQKKSHPYGMLQVPHFKKFRPAVTSKKEIEKVNNNQSCHKGELSSRFKIKTKYVDEEVGRQYLQGIILNLNSKRHFGAVKLVAKNDCFWNEKSNVAIFRGKLTGGYDTNPKIRTKGMLDRCLAIPRCRLVIENSKETLVDAKLTGTFGFVPSSLNYKNTSADLVAKKLKMKALLGNKAIIMVEGNDVASGLKWALFSQSVVMMQPPTVTTWAMEELLEPWKVS